MRIIEVRWLDGFKRKYGVKEYQMGQHNYWIRLLDGREKWIPRENVRHVTVLEDIAKLAVAAAQE